MIHQRLCKVCKKVIDTEECPYCREERLNKKREENGEKNSK